MRTAVYMVSDTHINSTVGLCTPTVELDDGGMYHASPRQLALWRSWLAFWERDYEADRRIVIFNGDIGELDTKRRSTQLVSQNKAQIIQLALDALAPAYAKADKVLFIRGTQAHTGKGGWLEETLAADCDIAIHENKKVASWYHFQGVIDGVRFDVAHHASMGRLPWTAPNAANRLASYAKYYYQAERGEPAPNVLVRSHNHKYADSGENFDTWAVCLPCWQLITEYGYRIGAELSLPDIGGVVVIVEDGTVVRKDKVLYKPKAKASWALKI